MCIVCGTTFRDSLFDKGLLFDTGVDGLYGRSGIFEDVLQRFSALVERAGADAKPETIHFPPAMTRRDLEKSGYLKNFPDMAGTIHAFAGKDREHATLVERLHGDLDWTEHQAVTDVSMAPAACYPLYPLVARRGRLPLEGGTYDVAGWVFRHEPSQEPTRMLTFRMREYVRIGTPAQVIAFRTLWIEKAQDIAEQLELPHEVDVANDPFLRPCRAHAQSEPARSGTKVRASRPRQRRQESDGLHELQLPPGPFRRRLGHPHPRWRNRAHRLRRLRHGARHPGAVQHHGLDVDSWPISVRAVLWG